MSMNNILILTLLLGVLGGSSFSAERKPNILVILADDVGWGDFQCYNPQGKIPTPHIDRMAREGMRFTNAHSGGAICSPTRYSMLTGNYPWRGKNPTGWPTHREGCQIRPGQKTIGAMLHDAGYRTAIYGKTHIGHTWPTTPSGEPDYAKPMTDGPVQWGFDSSCILPAGHKVRGEGFYFTDGIRDASMKFDLHTVDELLLQKALAFLDAHLSRDKSAPFYIHFCCVAAHEPFTPPAMLNGEPIAGVTKMGAHADFVYEVDVLVGAWRAALEKRGLLADTLVVVTSDNGGKPEEVDQGHDSVGGLRGKKHSIWEGGHRVPFIAMWPGKIPAGQVLGQAIATHDLVPTALTFARAAVPAGQCLDATSLAPLLLGQRDDAQPLRQHLLVQGDLRDTDPEDEDAGKKPGKRGLDKRAAIVAKRSTPNSGLAFGLISAGWKLVMNEDDKPVALFHLDEDLAEKRNLFKDPAQTERVQQMFTAYRAIRESKQSIMP